MPQPATDDDQVECPTWVELRNTQHEQMSSAFSPRTDVGSARPQNIARIECYGTSIVPVSAFAKLADLQLRSRHIANVPKPGVQCELCTHSHRRITWVGCKDGT